MKHEVTSMNTKKMLAASLKKFMEIKPFSKITVKELTDDCSLNRKTFYYHFEDTQQLLKWIFEQEAIFIVSEFDMLNNYEKAINYILNYIDDNKHILNCAYDSIGRDELKRFISYDFNGIVNKFIEEMEDTIDVHIDAGYRNFICSFYVEALNSIIINLIRTTAHYDRQQVIDYLVLTIKASIPNILKERAKILENENKIF